MHDKTSIFIKLDTYLPPLSLKVYILHDIKSKI